MCGERASAVWCALRVGDGPSGLVPIGLGLVLEESPSKKSPLAYVHSTHKALLELLRFLIHFSLLLFILSSRCPRQVRPIGPLQTSIPGDLNWTPRGLAGAGCASGWRI